MAQNLKVALYSFTLLFLISTTSFAVCQFDGITPDGGNFISCPAPVQSTRLTNSTVPATTANGDIITIPAGGGINVPVTFVAMNTSLGDDLVTVFGEVVSADSTALVTVAGNDTVIVESGFLSGGGVGGAIDTGSDNDTVVINGGTLERGGFGPVIATSSGEDEVTVNGGTITGEIRSGSDNDIVTINDGIFDGFITTSSGEDFVTINGGEFPSDLRIILGSSDDELVLNADGATSNFIQCDDGFDTIRFAMEVPGNRIGIATAQIRQSDPEGDSIFINDDRYRWTNCERLVPDLKAGPDVISPVPTLSEWGLIAMAGVLGLLSLMVIRRKQTA